mgnify:CR=1 FL=1|jgi:hypothetical protein
MNLKPIKPGVLVDPHSGWRHRTDFACVCPAQGARHTGLVLSYPDDKDQERACCPHCADYTGPVVAGPTVKVLWSGWTQPEYYCATYLMPAGFDRFSGEPNPFDGKVKR